MDRRAGWVDQGWIDGPKVYHYRSLRDLTDEEKAGLRAAYAQTPHQPGSGYWVHEKNGYRIEIGAPVEELSGKWRKWSIMATGPHSGTDAGDTFMVEVRHQPNVDTANYLEERIGSLDAAIENEVALGFAGWSGSEFPVLLRVNVMDWLTGNDDNQNRRWGKSVASMRAAENS